MTNYVNRCIIVPAAYAPLARALCDGIATGDSGYGMFIRAVSTDGSLPATHFISAGPIEDTFAALLPLTSYTADPITNIEKSTTALGQPSVIVALAKGAVTLAQVNALLGAINVTDCEPFAQLSRLGLKLVQESI